MKKFLIVIIGVLLLMISVIGTKTLAEKNEEKEQYNLKLIYEDEYVLDEMLDVNSNVFIKNEDEKIDNFEINKNEKITLESINVPHNKEISYCFSSV